MGAHVEEVDEQESEEEEKGEEDESNGQTTAMELEGLVGQVREVPVVIVRVRWGSHVWFVVIL